MEELLLGNLAQAMRYITEPQKNEALEIQKQRHQEGSELELLGRILMWKGYITDTRLSYMLKVQQLCEPMIPRSLYPADTGFGKSLTKRVPDKCAVAWYVTKNLTFVKEHDKLFIADGSHGYYLFMAIVCRGLDVSIVTNNLGVAGEYVLHSGKIERLKFPSNGVVKRDFGGIFELEKGALDEELKSSNIFLSCFAVVPDIDEGFCEDHDIKADVRRELLESRSRITILCDYNTLSHTAGHHTPIFQAEHNKKWSELLTRSYTRLVTTPHPDVSEQELKRLPTSRTPQVISAKEPPHSWKRYSQNSKRLYEIMGERFIEVDKHGNKLCYEKKVY